VPTEDIETVVPPTNLRGLDLLADPISWVDFSYFVRAKSEPLRVMLTNEDNFVGIGDIYADEILFDAGLRYDRGADQLTTMEVRRLHRSLVGVLHDAIKYRGTSLENRPFIDLNGAPGEFADHLAVYQKNGDLSPRNRQPIQKAQFKGKTVYFCGTQV
jgi:formamidopyrimidine-DNA glycosylase